MANSISLVLVENPEEAPTYGRGYTNLTITKGIVVRNGTEGGNPTVDLQLKDDKGNRYVAMITGKLLASVHEVVQARAKLNADNKGVPH